MMCPRCGTHPATAYFTKKVGGITEEYHLCTKCAQEIGFGVNIGMSFPLSDMLSEVLSKGFGNVGEGMQRGGCTQCGTTYGVFSKTGRFGCPMCYEFFAPRLPSLMNRLHGSSTHVGKIPAGAGKKISKARKISNLRSRLDEAIKNEQYEEAAKLRDSIRELNEQ